MCTYSFTLDDRLVAEAENTLSEGVQFQSWLQQQVEALLRKQVKRKHHSNRGGLSDVQLAQRLAQYAPLTDADFPELKKSDYDNYIHSNSGRITKGLEKWL